jgi:outer membrane protein
MKLNKLLFIGFLCIAWVGKAQNKQVFSLKNFYAQLEFHPIVYQSNLIVREAEKELQYSRGAFDPTIYSDYAKKDFAGKNYYSTWDNVLKIPTWIAADIKIGYENNTGQFLNNESVVPSTGLFLAGISVPIGRGLLIDQRRTTLRQAKIGVGISEFEKTKLLNKLYFEASKSYFDWAYSYNLVELNQFFYNLALERKTAIVDGVNVGENAPIDSVEINIELQRREISLISSRIDLDNARLMLSNHLWDAGNIPLEIDENAIPENIVELITSMQTSLLISDSVIINHPEIQKMNAKLEQLKFEKRLAVENLRPKLNVEYNPLFTTFNNQLNSTYITSNYKLGASLYTPIFIRKERAKLSLVKIKTEQTNQQLNFAKRDLLNQLKKSENLVNNFKNLIDLQTKNNVQIERLRNAENDNFMAGESNVFLVNTRERNLIDGQVKLVEFRLKYLKSLAEYRYDTGINILELIK